MGHTIALSHFCGYMGYCFTAGNIIFHNKQEQFLLSHQRDRTHATNVRSKPVNATKITI